VQDKYLFLMKPFAFVRAGNSDANTNGSVRWSIRSAG
jgi:hypothetical protein